MENPQPTNSAKPPLKKRAFRAAVFRGLGVLLPPLLTVLILIWVVNTVYVYVLKPVNQAASEGLVWVTADIRTQKPNGNYTQLSNGTYIPKHVFDAVPNAQNLSGEEAYRRYVEAEYLQPQFAIPLFLALFILLLYFLGKFIAIGVGGYFAGMFEGGIRRLPVVRNVYSAAKQISDFLFSEREFEFTRIVAVEFPRKGVWAVGFVTGEGLQDICESLKEPLVTILIPYSPLPVTGATIIVRKSECIDLNITFDQACEFIVSCGVVGAGEKVKSLQAATSNTPPLLE